MLEGKDYVILRNVFKYFSNNDVSFKQIDENIKQKINEKQKRYQYYIPYNYQNKKIKNEIKKYFLTLITLAQKYKF